MRKIFEEKTGDSLYEHLKMFQNNIIEPEDIRDPLIKKIKKNGIVELNFELTDYLECLSMDENDIYTLTYAFESYYSNYEFKDYYSSKDDWKEGIVLNYFDEENIGLLKKIKMVIAPQLDLENDGDVISSLLYDFFSRDTDSIISEYHNMTNNAIQESIKKTAKEELCDFLFDYRIYNVICFRKYYTTVKDLIRLYEEEYSTNVLDFTLKDLLKTLSDEKLQVPSEYSNWWDYDYYVNFDDETFNEYVKRELENMIEKMEDSELFTDIEEYKKITQRLEKFPVSEWLELPKSRNKKFRIMGVDPKTNKIMFDVVEYGEKIKNYLLDYQNFMSFLYNYELF